MRTFLVQSKKQIVNFDDFSSELIESCQYQNWYYRNEVNNLYITNDGITCTSEENQTLLVNELMDRFDNNVVPVGTIDFVQKIMSRYHGKEYISAINIPDELTKYEFTQRDIARVSSVKELVEIMKEPMYSEGAFVKSDTRCKTGETGKYNFNDIQRMANCDMLREDKYIVSSLINIKAEWRVFVGLFMKSPVINDCRQYEGDWQDRFDSNFIENAVKAYTKCPPAYTLDVALLKNGKMAVIEAHNLISCGLYGFMCEQHIPQMFNAAYMYEIGKLGETH